MKFIAIDMGASSGRVIEFNFIDGKLDMDIIHRFTNGTVKDEDSYVWDIEYLFNEIIKGLKLASDVTSIGIDTWGVDYVCLNDGKLDDKPYSYRDLRTINLESNLNPSELFYKTGIGYLPFNTGYQLEASKELNGYFLMIPDYITYLLTDQVSNELTNSITTQLIDYSTKDFDKELLNKVNQQNLIFSKPTQLKKWPVTDEIEKQLGYRCHVVQVATHDTACAYLGSPNLNDSIIISLGTWAIVGCLTENPIINDDVLKEAFSNEGSIEGKYRFQKNSMGMWMFENLRKEFNDSLDYETLIEEVSKSSYNQIIDVNDEVFLNPDSMLMAIDDYLDKYSGLKPNNKIEYYKLVFDSMIHSYINIIKKINTFTNRDFEKINIVGGGCQNRYICLEMQKKLNKEVNAGPVEATAYGNVACQMIANNIIKNHREFCSILHNSTEIEIYRKGEGNGY